MQKKSGHRTRAITALCVCLAVIMAAAMPAAGAAEPRLALSGNGLYVTDDGQYSVYILGYDPGAAGIAEYLGTSVPSYLTIPSSVELNGVTVPVHEVGYSAYANHPELETVDIPNGVVTLSGNPFAGCSGLRRIIVPESLLNVSTVLFNSFDHVIEIVHRSADATTAADRLSAEFSAQDVSGGQEFTVTFALRDDAQSFGGYVYTVPIVQFVSASPMDPGAASDMNGRYSLRLGGDDGNSRTFTFRASESGELVQIAAMGESYGSGGIAPVEITYCVPNGQSVPSVQFDAPVYLPIPTDNAPMQEETLALTNQIRSSVGASPLSMSSVLNQAAMVRATEMALAQEMSHTRPDGSMCYTVISNFGESFGENVIMPGGGPAENVAATSVEWWRTSPGHYANMVEPGFNVMGAGYARGANGAWYGCQLFGTIRSEQDMWYAVIDSVKLQSPYDPSALVAASEEPSEEPEESLQPAETMTPQQSVKPGGAETQAQPTQNRPQTSPDAAQPTQNRPQASPDAAQPTWSAAPSDWPNDADMQEIGTTNGLHIEKQDWGYALRGFEASQPTTCLSLLRGLVLPDGVTAVVVAQDGTERKDTEYVVTGDRIHLAVLDMPMGVLTAVVQGDVLGTGTMGLSQLISSAQALSGKKTLAGPYFDAADYNGSGQLELSDLVLHARALIQG